MIHYHRSFLCSEPQNDTLDLSDRYVSDAASTIHWHDNSIENNDIQMNSIEYDIDTIDDSYSCGEISWYDGDISDSYVSCSCNQSKLYHQYSDTSHKQFKSLSCCNIFNKFFCCRVWYSHHHIEYYRLMDIIYL